jgi:hypothetical protein
MVDLRMLEMLLRACWEDGRAHADDHPMEATDAFQAWRADAPFGYLQGFIDAETAAQVDDGHPVAPNVSMIPFQPHAAGYLNTRGCIARAVGLVVWRRTAEAILARQQELVTINGELVALDLGWVDRKKVIELSGVREPCTVTITLPGDKPRPLTREAPWQVAYDTRFDVE